MTAKLNIRSALFLLLASFILAPGCKDLELEIQDTKDRLDVLEGSPIASIEEQFTAINKSISDLKTMDESLTSYITALQTAATDLQKQIDAANAEIAKVESELEKEITDLGQSLLKELKIAKGAIETELLAINTTLSELKKADEALDKKISALQTYVDTQLTSTASWANATFSTLTQYEQTQTDISAIKSSIEQVNAGLAALETRLAGKIATDIQTAIAGLRTDLTADYVAKIETAVNAVTQAYISAISKASDEITAAYTAAIAAAIKESEANLMAWVNEQLLKGYYDIAAIDGKLSALSTRLDETDTDLQKQLAEQQAALEASKEELTKAYKNAIKEAIEENNGVISASIAESVQKLEDKMQARLTVIETNISNVQKQIANISKDINSIYEQIEKITSSLSDLQDIDTELQILIANLETELADLQKDFESLKPTDESAKEMLVKEIDNLKALIQALQAKDVELQKQISALQSYVDAELKETADWAEATFATLEQYSAMQDEISAIKTLIDKTKSDITEEYTTAIEAAISNSETSMKAWVNTLLAQGYYTISDINGKVSALEALIADGDNNLQKQINEQKTALQQAKADLTNEYKQYINQAIASGGIIDQAIAAQVKKVQDEFRSKIDAINERLDAFEDRLGKLEKDFVNRIQSLKYIPEFSDKKVMVSDIFRMEVSLDFLVTPASQAEAVKDAWEANPNILSSYLRYTKSPETRSISPAIPLEVTSVGVNESGVLNVTMRETDDNPVDADYWCKNFEGVIYIQVSDSNSDVVSDFVDVETFINDLSQIEDKDLFKDLSPYVNGKYQSSNCYIVSESGLYKFKIFKGNSNILAGAVSDVEPEGIPTDADLLWESFGNSTKPKVGDIIKNVKFQDEYIYFRTPEKFAEGNAVVAIKDAYDNILWSWHLWCTDMPSECVYNANGDTMMDRNLGATSIVIGEKETSGLLYQWGRKDPFLGYFSSTSTIKWADNYTYSNSTTGTIKYTIMNPTEFIGGNTSNSGVYQDWHYKTNKNRWQSSKTMYDPCPSGWRVPDKINWNGDSISDKTDDGGYSFSILTPSSTWYPASGFSQSASGASYYGKYGAYWTISSYFRFAYYVSLSYEGYRSYGYSVRCQKE